MIRKIYGDVIRARLASGDLRWLGKRSVQYALIHASHWFRRPLCGPVLGTLVTNYRCNYRCQMCDLPLRDEELRGAGRKEMPTREMKRVVRDLAALGVSGIGFTGGEPLLRSDIFELLGYAKSLGLITHLNTNGFLLNDAAARGIIDAKVDSLNISLDGARAGTHDKIRGVPGAFDRVLGGVARLNALRRKGAPSVRVKSVAVIDQTNIQEALDLVRLSRDSGFDCIEFIPRQPFRTSDREAVRMPDESFLLQVRSLESCLLEARYPGIKIENSPAHIRLFKHSFRNHDSPIPCLAGYNSCVVDCYGDIYPCVPWMNWRRTVGTVQATSLSEFWYSSEYRRAREEIASCRKCYLNCQAELNIAFNLFRSRSIA